ncbi:hypothetical protein KY495_07005 [Massilia sp. PAMC28688]|uniref:hypothetical protein n=1 Tax=Massilia sp. PAMC28688 TaxID=2861283 RepID=UPI001C62A007|nr:hypothetical protein [Massilia sp. PAMC28688]QYF94919.1 hypothetical protein KY495_07005 [Massilia sp. PAMC28688]
MNICVVLAMSVASLASASVFLPVSNGGAGFQRQLVRTIETADRVVVREHSDPMDFYTGDGTIPTVPEKTYTSRQLNSLQQNRLVSFMRAMNPAAREAWAACMPEFHHTIEMYKARKRIGTMKVCFGCGHIDFDKSSSEPPAAIFMTLGMFVSELGMATKRDWHQLAHAKQPAGTAKR